MSGVKRISVDQGEWARVQREAARFRDVRRDLPEMISRVRQQNQREIERAFGEVDRRQREVEQALEGLSDRAREFERATNRRLREQSARMREALRTTREEIRRETRELLAEQERALRSELRRVDEGLAALRDDKARESEAARRTLADGRLMHDVIRDRLPHERFAPGRLADLEARLAAAQAHLDAGMGGPALAGAQEAYHRLRELRVEIELRDREWREALLDARDSLTTVRERIRASVRLPVFAEDGTALDDIELDVDFWSKGGLSRLGDELDAALNRVADDATPLDLAELRKIAGEHAPAFAERLTGIVERADLALRSSQVRVNIADLVVRTLDEESGYSLEDSTYGGGDERNAFYAKLRHPNGSEIVVDVSPESDDSADCALRLLSYETDTASDDERSERAHVIADSLKSRGLKVETPVAERDEPDPRQADFDLLRAQSGPGTAGQASGPSAAGARAQGAGG
ncbi:hypothetical protein [Streptosporangium sp. NPDC051022]|uniref:hypothetical protein n=1 Tax=Streptosporangium sp. NPDC051022 TaxID=3155752 RepID=UPI0034210B5C